MSASRFLLSVASVALLWSVPAFAAPAEGALRYSIVVDKFENKTEQKQLLGDQWATLLTSALYESGRFIVVAESDMQHKALDEQARGTSGTTAQGRKTAARAHMTPAQLIVKGVITHFQSGATNQGGGFQLYGFNLKGQRQTTEISATLQMIDATTGALVAAKNFTASTQGRGMAVERQGANGSSNASVGSDPNAHEVMAKAISQVIPWMVAQLPSVPWRGSVVKVDARRIIINRGSREGVSQGDEFIVGESEILRDPDTGETLDEVLHERARIRVEQVGERTAVCSIVTGEKGQIVEGMAIQQGKEKS